MNKFWREIERKKWEPVFTLDLGEVEILCEMRGENLIIHHPHRNEKAKIVGFDWDNPLHIALLRRVLVKWGFLP